MELARIVPRPLGLVVGVHSRTLRPFCGSFATGSGGLGLLAAAEILEELAEEILHCRESRREIEVRQARRSFSSRSDRGSGSVATSDGPPTPCPTL